MKPKLTQSRANSLMGIARLANASSFLAADEANRSGPAMVSLEKAGWVERVEATPSSAPFEIPTRVQRWRVTDEGKKAITALQQQEAN